MPQAPLLLKDDADQHFYLPELPDLRHTEHVVESTPKKASWFSRFFHKEKTVASTPVAVPLSTDDFLHDDAGQSDWKSKMPVPPAPSFTQQQSALKDVEHRITTASNAAQRVVKPESAPAVLREEHVVEEDHKMQLHRRLDAEVRERHAHLDAKEKMLEEKEEDLSELHQELEEHQKDVEKQLAQADKLKKMQDEVENREITVRYQESKILEITRELEEQKKALAQKEEELARKEEQIKGLKTSLDFTSSSLQQSESQVNVEDDAILYLEKELERSKRQFRKQIADEQLRRPVVSADVQRIRDAINECRVLISIQKIDSAKEQYTSIKNQFERLKSPDRDVYKDILKLYEEIKTSIDHDAI